MLSTSTVHVPTKVATYHPVTTGSRPVARLRHAEHHRGEVLRGEVDRWREADAIRAYCAAVESAYPEATETVEWIAGARRYAGQIAPPPKCLPGCPSRPKQYGAKGQSRFWTDRIPMVPECPASASSEPGAAATVLCSPIACRNAKTWTSGSRPDDLGRQSRGAQDRCLRLDHRRSVKGS